MHSKKKASPKPQSDDDLLMDALAGVAAQQDKAIAHVFTEIVASIPEKLDVLRVFEAEIIKRLFKAREGYLEVVMLGRIEKMRDEDACKGRE